MLAAGLFNDAFHSPADRLASLLARDSPDGNGERPRLQAVMASEAIDKLMWCARGRKRSLVAFAA